MWLDQEVDGETFLDLNEDDIKQLTKKLGLVKKLIRIIEEVRVMVITNCDIPPICLCR